MATPMLLLSDAHSIPAIGFGTYPLRGNDGVDAVVSAISSGYRLIDTAFNYDNEGAVGEGIRRSGIRREDLFLTSKLPGRFHQKPDADNAIRESLWRLGVEYVDLYLIHWPNPLQGHYLEAWEALIAAREEGLVKSIGVSNFTAEHLQHLRDATGILPVVNQIEMHPYFPQTELLAHHEALGIRTQAWSPLGKREAPHREGVIAEIASRHQVTPVQTVLRWHIQRGVIPIPKSATTSRQEENIDVFDFELTVEDMNTIAGLGRVDGRLFDGDPNYHEEM